MEPSPLLKKHTKTKEHNDAPVDRRLRIDRRNKRDPNYTGVVRRMEVDRRA